MSVLVVETLAAVVLAVTGPPDTEPVHPERTGCETRRCRHRTARKRRVQRMRHVTRPHRPWLRSTAACESGGDYTANTGNGFYGGLQFTINTWRAAGGKGMPHHASRLEQEFVAVRWAQRIGWGNVRSSAGWPSCG